jgi:dTMP kinase
MGRGLGIEKVYAVNEYALDGVMPDLTIMLDLDAEAGISRKKNQAELDRMESETMEFHKKVVEGYRTLAEAFPERIVSIDASLPKEQIHGIIKEYVVRRL